jgi:1,2-diacylglycerol 3-beta-galactosyltransferase
MPVWKLVWQVSNRAPADKFVIPTVLPLLKNKIATYLREVQPDVVVSVHPLMNDLVLKVMRRIRLSVPFLTVVTDMVDLHPLWIDPEVDFCMVPTEPARLKALKFGCPAEKLLVVGQPVALKFAQETASKATLRHKLGLQSTRKTILLVGGGEGFGRLFDIARAIASQVSVAQLLIIAGRNRMLKQKLEAVVWEIPTHVYGFVDNMPELMRCADIIVTKAGPGTISEALVSRLPLILFDYIPGQEKGNVSYVIDHGVGVFVQNPLEIARLINVWLEPENLTLPLMAEKAAALAKPEAALTIAQKICGFI